MPEDDLAFRSLRNGMVLWLLGPQQMVDGSVSSWCTRGSPDTSPLRERRDMSHCCLGNCLAGTFNPCKATMIVFHKERGESVLHVSCGTQSMSRIEAIVVQYPHRASKTNRTTTHARSRLDHILQSDHRWSLTDGRKEHARTDHRPNRGHKQWPWAKKIHRLPRMRATTPFGWRYLKSGIELHDQRASKQYGTFSRQFACYVFFLPIRLNSGRTERSVLGDAFVNMVRFVVLHLTFQVRRQLSITRSGWCTVTASQSARNQTEGRTRLCDTRPFCFFLRGFSESACFDYNEPT